MRLGNTLTKKKKWKSFDLVRTNNQESAPQKKKERPETVAKTKHSGFSLVRNDHIYPPPSTSKAKKDPTNNLARIRTRRVIRGADGEIYDLTKKVDVWLVQLDEINLIFIADALKGQGYQVTECNRLDLLLTMLKEAEEAPKLIVIEARVVGQQTPFFRKMLLPQIEEKGTICLLTGVANETQKTSFRRWYDGPMTVGGDIDSFVEAVVELIGTV